MSKAKRKSAEVDVRVRLEKYLSQYHPSPAELESLWEDCGEMGWLNLEDNDKFDDLCERAERLLGVLRKHKKREGQQSRGEEIIRDTHEQVSKPIDDPTPLIYTNSERARNTALAHWYAKRALLDEDVQWFRKEILDGQLLTLEETISFAESPVLAVLSYDDLAEYNIPSPYYSAQQAKEEQEVDQMRRVVNWNLTATVERGRTINIQRSGDLAPPFLLYGKQGWVHSRAVRQSSVLSTLLLIAQSLARQYGWREVDAVLFVLMDGIPPIRPLQIASENLPCGRPVLTITIEPWMSWATLEAAYKAQQEDEYGVMPGEIGKQAAALLTFVADYTNKDVFPSKGEERHKLMKQWNDHADEIASAWEWKAKKEGQSWKFSNIDQFSRKLRDARTGIIDLKYSSFPERIHRMRRAARSEKLSAHDQTSDSHPDSQDE